ncbi:MAG TPA: FAD-dependent oxidoreductase [Alphaproteobacteria bacterium]|nr:FAD-dependent oxidoreductase [Alphaproteobacteria bacterium]
MTILSPDDAEFALTVPLVIVGAGACGLTAALAASEAGAEVVVLERDPIPMGSTAMSSGMIPAAGTRIQAAKGIDDTPELFAGDLRRKAKDLNDPAMVEAIARASGPTIDWLAHDRGIPLELVEGFRYPGHSRLRMHAPPGKTGQALMDALRSAAETAGIEILCDAHVTALFADESARVHGLRYERPDGSHEDLGCGALLLACNGFGGNAAMVARNIPEIADALYFGHAGNQGEGINWGAALGAASRDMSGYQGHGSIAHPHGIQITWALMMEGGVQVNAHGARFSNEHQGYSEQAVSVQAQPDGIAFDIYDARIHDLGMTFDDYRTAFEAGAVKTAGTPEALAEATGLPAEALVRTMAETQALAAGNGACPFGRDFSGQPALAPPYYAVRVTAALLHTQGGLVVDTEGRVLREDGTALPNLFAGGGAACGISGPHVSGYLSGNGLLTATVLGRLAGRAAAAQVL